MTLTSCSYCHHRAAPSLEEPCATCVINLRAGERPIFTNFVPAEEKETPVTEKITSENYVQLCMRTDTPITPELLARFQNPQTIRLIHAAMGMMTETGEFMDILKRHLFMASQSTLSVPGEGTLTSASQIFPSERIEDRNRHDHQYAGVAAFLFSPCRPCCPSTDARNSLYAAGRV